jgi:hypothetical protein
MIHKFFKWAFKKEFEELETLNCRVLNSIQDDYISQTKRMNERQEKLMNVLNNIDMSVDVHEHADSWAVISIQGQKTDYVKFVNLGRKDLMEIAAFLRHYDRAKVDATPNVSNFLKIERTNY